MFIFVIHLLVGAAVTIFLICGHRSSVYTEIKDEKLANGEISSSYAKSPQNSVTESMKRYEKLRELMFMSIGILR